MKLSTERFLTTHTGSLPRPADLTRTMFAKEEGVPVDVEALSAQIGGAIDIAVARQIDAGIDVVNDGEMSKPSYATYVKDRLSGFEGTGQPLVYQDLVDFPALATRVFGDPGRSRRQTPACTGPIAFDGPQAVAADIENLKRATAGDRVSDCFLTAASPGVIALFFRDDYYRSREEYLFAIADAMRHEYRLITDAGFVLQVDCPDLGMGRHIQFADLTIEEFRKEARLNIDALNHALEGLPPELLRLHLCWGNYEGPHHLDVPLADIIDIVFLARPNAVSFEAANPLSQLLGTLAGSTTTAP